MNRDMHRKSAAGGRFLRLTAGALAAVLLLGGCGAESQLRPEDREETGGSSTSYTVPPDGSPEDESCKGSYFADFAPDTVVAKVGRAELTNGELNAFYHLMVNGYREETGKPVPDFSLPLDGQMIDGKNITWQQYFLRTALNAWHTCRALEQKSLEPSVRTEKGFRVDPKLHAKYMTDMPINKILYGEDNTFHPNALHQAYLDGIPKLLDTLAQEQGYGDAKTMAQAELGTESGLEDLQKAAHLVNIAYMYYTELSYDQRPTAQQVKDAMHPSGRKLIDLRHILVIPAGAKKGQDGKIQATQEQWDQAQMSAQELIDMWQKNWKRSEASFAALAHDFSGDPNTALNGGLYANVKQGQLIAPLDRWCFDPARQPGDMDIIRSDYGCHVVYFCDSRDENYPTAEYGLLKSGMDELTAQAREAYPMEVDYEKITLLPTEGQGKLNLAEDLLYPDVAHERITEVPVYIQQDYLGAPYGSGSVSSHGCGITTLAMLSTYMADEYLTPGVLAERYRGRYSSSTGTDAAIFTDTPPEMGYFLNNRYFEWEYAEEGLRDHHKVVTLQYKGYFTRGGHFLCLSEIDDQGMLTIRDSNVYNYKRLKEHINDAFPCELVQPASQSYWVYDYKVVSLPNCVRCKDVPDPHNVDMSRAPALLEGYVCPKCRQALARREGFLSTAGLN